MDKIKVLFAVSGTNIGGGETYILRILQHIDKERFEVAVAAPSSTLFYRRAKELAHNMHDIPFMDNADLYSLLKLFYISRKYDVIHANLNRAALFSGVLSKFSDRFIIGTMHGIDRPFYYRLLPHVILLSRFQSEYFKNILKKNSMMGVRLGIDTMSEQPVCKDISNLDMLEIGCVGRLHELKGQDTLIKALRVINESGIDARLHLIGDGSERQHLEDLAEQLCVKDRVVFTGNIVDVAGYLKEHIHIGAFATHKENIPVSILECMSCGIPVIASDVGGIGEEITQKENLIEDFNDHKTFATKIIDLYNDHERYKRISLENVKIVRRRFDIRPMVRKLERIYEKGSDLHK